MLPDNLDRHLRTMDAWLDAWVPRDFDGIVCFDLERWSIRDDSLHRQHRDQDHRDRLTPDKTLPDLMADFVRATEARARALRPRVREWGWWGLAGINPGFPVWKPDEYERSKTTELAWAHWLSTVQTPMPVYYFNASIRPDDRPRAWAELTASHQRLFGRERLARDGIAYLSAQGPPTPDGGWRLLTPDEFRESFVAARDAGLRRFIVWAAIDSPQTRDGLQRFIDDTLAPLAREVGAE